MRLSIIVVSFNTADLTMKAVESAWLDAQTSPQLKDKTELFVVDNHSIDSSLEKLNTFAKQSKNIHILAQPHNLGFAKANNLAIKQATGELILLLNSDTITHSGALNQLCSHFAEDELPAITATLSSAHGQLDNLGIVAAALNNPDGSYQPQGGSFPTLFSLATHMLLLDDIPVLGKLLPSTQHTGHNAHEAKRNGLEQKEWVGGTAMLIRKAVIDEVGDLDQNIFMYGEDMELCLRAHRHAWDVAIDHDAHITHYGSASASSIHAIKGEFAGYRYIWAKHKPHWQRPLVSLLLRLGATIRFLLFSFYPRKNSLVTVYKELAATS